MSVICILALEKHSLISDTIANLINSSDYDLTLILGQAENLDELNDEIYQHTADTTLLVTSSNYFNEETLIKLLLSHPKLGLIILNEDSNWLHIYRRDDKLLTSSLDLLTAIEFNLNHLFSQEVYREQ